MWEWRTRLFNNRCYCGFLLMLIIVETTTHKYNTSYIWGTWIKIILFSITNDSRKLRYYDEEKNEKKIINHTQVELWVVIISDWMFDLWLSRWKKVMWIELSNRFNPSNVRILMNENQNFIYHHSHHCSRKSFFFSSEEYRVDDEEWIEEKRRRKKFMNKNSSQRRFMSNSN
jgi:hypothetical protein